MVGEKLNIYNLIYSEIHMFEFMEALYYMPYDWSRVFKDNAILYEFSVDIILPMLKEQKNLDCLVEYFRLTEGIINLYYLSEDYKETVYKFMVFFHKYYFDKEEIKYPLINHFKEVLGFTNTKDINEVKKVLKNYKHKYVRLNINNFCGLSCNFMRNKKIIYEFEQNYPMA